MKQSVSALVAVTLLAAVGISLTVGLSVEATVLGGGAPIRRTSVQRGGASETSQRNLAMIANRRSAVNVNL
jgi:hypothetical protein